MCTCIIPVSDDPMLGYWYAWLKKDNTIEIVPTHCSSDKPCALQHLRTRYELFEIYNIAKIITHPILALSQEDAKKTAMGVFQVDIYYTLQDNRWELLEIK